MKRLAGSAWLGLLLVAACMPTTAAEKPAKGDKLINVPLVTLSGKRTSLAKLAKGRVVVFEFGATW